MATLTPDRVRLGAQAVDKDEAIRLAGELLVNTGCVAAEYIDGMLRRESTASTFLGAGIAIPHGTFEDRALVHHAGISVLQLPSGVEWGLGERVHLVVGIAARSDEHVGLLQRLAEVAEDERTVRDLIEATDPDFVVDCLERQTGGPASGRDGVESGIELVIGNPAGLHARPALEFVNVARGFASEVTVLHGGRRANGKSMASLLTLGAIRGSTIRIEATGEDCDAALRALADMIAALKAKEADEAGPRPIIAAASHPVPASPGLAIGPVHKMLRRRGPTESHRLSPATERDRLRSATGTARGQLLAIGERLNTRSAMAEAAILDVSLEILEDPELLSTALGRVDHGQTAEIAWHSTLEERARQIDALEDPRLAARAADFRDAAARVARILSAAAGELADSLPDHPVVIVADELSPSDTASLDTSRVLGLCTAGGAPQSHASILARAIGLPSVVNAGPDILQWPDGTIVMLDGDTGVIAVSPDAEARKRARMQQQCRDERRRRAAVAANEPAVTQDGRRILVMANVGSIDETVRAERDGAEGVGVLRTEFLFLDRREPPGEDEQFEVYRAVVRAMGGKPVVVRTLDVGGDKPLGYVRIPPEANPFLGVRGLRFSLTRPELLRSQLRAALRAAEAGTLRIMLPMITEVSEWHLTRGLVREAALEAGVPEVEVGIMVEVPSAAILSDVFAREVDFLSIGTNDLTQYTLAIDRTHPTLAAKADGLQPAVLRLVARTIEAAHESGRKVSICGELASDPGAVPILVGLGVDELSVAVPAVAMVKAQIRELSFEAAREVAAAALGCADAAEVRKKARLT